MLVVVSLETEGDVSPADQIELTALHVGLRDLDEVVGLAIAGWDDPSFPFSSVHKKARLCTIDRSFGGIRNALLLGVSLAHEYGLDQFELYHAARDESSVISTDSNMPYCETWRQLHHLDEYHSNRALTQLSSSLTKIRQESKDFDSQLGTQLRDYLDPLATFASRLSKAIESLPSRDIDWNRFQNVERSIKALDLNIYVQSITESLKLIDPELRNLDFIKVCSKFFALGVRAVESVQARDQTTRNEGMKVLLSWLAAYSYAASRNAEQQKRYNDSLLLAFRALEFYILSYLWRLNRLALKSGDIYLNDAKIFGFNPIWEAYRRVISYELPNDVEKDIRFFRDHRNMNILTHGFANPHAEVARAARKAAKSIISMNENNLPNPLFEGILKEFHQGEKWSGNLGSKISEKITSLAKH